MSLLGPSQKRNRKLNLQHSIRLIPLLRLRPIIQLIYQLLHLPVLRDLHFRHHHPLKHRLLLNQQHPSLLPIRHSIQLNHRFIQHSFQLRALQHLPNRRSCRSQTKYWWRVKVQQHLRSLRNESSCLKNQRSQLKLILRRSIRLIRQLICPLLHQPDPHSLHFHRHHQLKHRPLLNQQRTSLLPIRHTIQRNRRFTQRSFQPRVLWFLPNRRSFQRSARRVRLQQFHLCRSPQQKARQLCRSLLSEFSR